MLTIFPTGDLFGVSLRSLLDLVQKPYGCGEQNVVRVALILAVLDYLNNAGQLTEVIYQKAKAYMSEGYYRHLFCASGGAYRLLQNSIENDNSITLYGVIQKYSSSYIKSPRAESETDREISLTAYVSIALLEYDYSSEDTPLTGALECLKNASKSEQKIYDRAIMLYAFTLAKLPEYSQPLLQRLMSKAKVEGSTAQAL
ncbi:unnamed protein product [Ranitomeya imitator]|uniref:Alpha-macroglobulin-like TED domain-containing protein n=1 Tax=Ranitomeya imitator TaxID=111125 RepID=A0ABN9L7J1_9NEOB|nr:unnamed protein product [Ranitomeya imitator]